MDKMDMNMKVAAFLLLMVVVIVASDVLFFRHYFWDRLMANVGTALVFIAFYLRFFRHS